MRRASLRHAPLHREMAYTPYVGQLEASLTSMQSATRVQAAFRPRLPNDYSRRHRNSRPDGKVFTVHFYRRVAGFLFSPSLGLSQGSRYPERLRLTALRRRGMDDAAVGSSPEGNKRKKGMSGSCSTPILC